jgi:hypothetical protein
MLRAAVALVDTRGCVGRSDVAPRVCACVRTRAREGKWKCVCVCARDECACAGGGGGGCESGGEHECGGVLVNETVRNVRSENCEILAE